MFLYLLNVSAFYLLENKTTKFLTVSRPSLSLVEFDLATDFKLHRGALQHLNVTLEDPTKKLAIDQARNTEKVIGYPIHKKKNQSHRIVLMPTDEFAITHYYKCLTFDRRLGMHIVKECTDDFLTFSIFYEASVIPEISKAKNSSEEFTEPALAKKEFSKSQGGYNSGMGYRKYSVRSRYKPGVSRRVKMRDSIMDTSSSSYISQPVDAPENGKDYRYYLRRSTRNRFYSN